MQRLNADWITEGRIDFEYKKYLLLAYLQEVDKHFNESRLYPFLSDLVFHYTNLFSLKKNKKAATNQFPQKISKLDLENFKLEYERLLQDDEYMEEIESIVDFAIPRIKYQLEEGKEIYEFVEDKIDIFPIGVVPIYAAEGYMLMKEKEKRKTDVYEYAITLFESADEKYRGIKTSYITTYTLSPANTLEMVKTDLIRNQKKLPNPATYVVESELSFPMMETLLPIAKRKMVKLLSEKTDKPN